MAIHIGGKATNCLINESDGTTQTMVTTGGTTATTTTVSHTKKRGSKSKKNNSKPTFSGMNISIGTNNTQVIVSSDD